MKNIKKVKLYLKKLNKILFYQDQFYFCLQNINLLSNEPDIIIKYRIRYLNNRMKLIEKCEIYILHKNFSDEQRFRLIQNPINIEFFLDKIS